MTKMHIAPPVKTPAKRNRFGEFAAFVFTIGVGLAGAVVFVAAVAVALSFA
jgi:hypothetical protein